MRTTTDAIRSTARYLGEALGEEWSVSLYAEQGTFIRPAVAIRSAGPTLVTGARHTAELVKPLALYAYPAPGESVEASYAAAADADEAMFTALRIGVGAGHAARIPLYDYDSVPMDESSEARGYADYIRVLDLSIDRVQSPDDEKLWTVIGNLRLGWLRSTLQQDATRLVQDVRLRIAGE